MKTLFLSALMVCVAIASQAAPSIVVSISGFPLANNGTYTYPFPVNQGTVQTFSFAISNSGGTNLDLTAVNSNYITLSGSAASYVTHDESAVVSPIAPGPSNSVSFTVTSLSTAPPGNYSLTLTIVNSDGTRNPYTGTVNYTIAATTNLLTEASEVGLSLFPNPSLDGKINIHGTETVNKIVVFGANGVKEEINESAKYFYTKQKGVLIVHLYTAKGIVYEKIVVQ